LSIGQRDARLLTLREWMFGPHLVSLATCSNCGERLELAFDTDDIRVVTETEPVEEMTLRVDDYEVRFRLPNSLDLMADPGYEDVTAGEDLLLDRCLLAVQHRDETEAADQLPGNVIDAVVERMAQVDPQADVQLTLNCPSCQYRWQATFDIVSFLWSEINTWAYRTLHEVHILASAYGWREVDILAMSSWRRQFYLNMVGK
jgi:hypothetical protein